MSDKRQKSLCDALGQNARYIVLEKKNRLQIFESPADKDIRAKIKAGWELVGWVRNDDGESKLPSMIREYYSSKVKATA